MPHLSAERNTSELEVNNVLPLLFLHSHQQCCPSWFLEKVLCPSIQEHHRQHIELKIILSPGPCLLQMLLLPGCQCRYSHGTFYILLRFPTPVAIKLAWNGIEKKKEQNRNRDTKDFETIMAYLWCTDHGMLIPLETLHFNASSIPSQGAPHCQLACLMSGFYSYSWYHRSGTQSGNISTALQMSQPWSKCGKLVIGATHHVNTS
jgi:hypothetical protein